MGEDRKENRTIDILPGGGGDTDHAGMRGDERGKNHHPCQAEKPRVCQKGRDEVKDNGGGGWV